MADIMFGKYKRKELMEKIGGYFPLCALINKRKKELATGMPPFVDVDTENFDIIIAEEIMQEKISLDQAGYDIDLESEAKKLDLMR